MDKVDKKAMGIGKGCVNCISYGFKILTLICAAMFINFNCRKLSMRTLTPSTVKRHCQAFLKRYVQI